MFRITNADATRNVETYKKLLLETVDKVRNVTRLTTMESEQGVLTFFGPTPTGKTVVRFVARRRNDAKMLKGHFELSMHPEEAVRWAMKEGSFL